MQMHNVITNYFLQDLVVEVSEEATVSLRLINRKIKDIVASNEIITVDMSDKIVGNNKLIAL